jgi:hypothetical protein
MAMKDLRGLAARNPEGMVCYYCKVPTAATIEHMDARAEGGKSKLDNLVLACPYCNTRKSTRSAQEFIESKRFELIHPELPDDAFSLMRENFGWVGGDLLTNSPHSRVRVKDDYILLLIRPNRKYPWTIINLGYYRNPKVVSATYDFLARHYTPKKPKQVHQMHKNLFGERKKLG